MSLLLTKIQNYLHTAANKRTLIDQDTVKQFSSSCSSALFNQFERYRGKKFTIRMSSIGRPLCQLQAEKYGLPEESQDYELITRFLLGDILEAYLMFLMRNAGIDIQSEQQRVTLKIGGIDLSGTYDVEIDGKIWDIKSASDFMFNNKFGERGGFQKILDDDVFGYIPQLFVYSEASGKPVGGWIVINKNNGKITVLEFPINDKKYRAKALQEIHDKIIALTSDALFKKCFEPVEEVYYQKKTGNMVLPMACSFCKFKKHCWPDAKFMPSPVSTAKSPPWKWYMFIAEEWK